MLDKIVSKVPVKYHSALRRGLLFVAFFAGDFGLLLFIGFTEEKEETGLLIKKTIYHPLSERLGYLAGSIVLIIIALISLLLAWKITTIGGRFKKYIGMIQGVDRIELQRLAEMTNSSPRDVADDLQNMIDSEFIENYYIDYKNEMLVNRSLASKQLKKISVKCQQCGATNEVIVGMSERCEYCDSPLVY